MPPLAQRVVASLRTGSLRRDISVAWRSARLRRRALAPDPARADGTWSSRRLNHFAAMLGQTEAYLEIGVEYGRTFEAVAVPRRVAVDPDPQFSLEALPAGVSVFPGISDDFFASLDTTAAFDVAFLDGLHAEAAERYGWALEWNPDGMTLRSSVRGQP